MRLRRLLYLSVILPILTILACVGTTGETKSMAIDACISLCNEAVSEGVDLSNGPCLSDDNPEWNIDDWVCDVAHSPRQDVDNLPENQCREFREGRAHHFVEVNEKCELIRVY